MIINAPKWGRAIRRVFNFPSAEGFNLAGDIFPMHPVNHPDAADQLWDRGEHLFGGYMKQAAVAAQVSTWYLQAGLGQIAVLEQLTVVSSGAGIIWGWTFSPTVTPLAAQSFSSDARDIPRKFWTPTTETAGRRGVLTSIGTAATPPGGTTLGGLEPASGGPLFITLLPSPGLRVVVFTPGPEFGLQVVPLTFFVSTVSTAVNASLNVQYRGWERPYEASELADWT